MATLDPTPQLDTSPSAPTTGEVSVPESSTSLTLVSESGAEFESLEQLGPTVASVVKANRTDQFLRQLDAFSKVKEAEVERLCNEHYQDFVSAVERLATIREGTRELRDRVVMVNDTLQMTGRDLVEKVKRVWDPLLTAHLLIRSCSHHIEN